MVADLLGISDAAAIGWHAAVGGDRASYVAGRLRESLIPGAPKTDVPRAGRLLHSR
ncbi:hypothetical protein NE236_37845 [Actinoallomurus purpureus]|nr:hypothetical protein [Actinoallomurus purpureus]